MPWITSHSTHSTHSTCRWCRFRQCSFCPAWRRGSDRNSRCKICFKLCLNSCNWSILVQYRALSLLVWYTPPSSQAIRASLSSFPVTLAILSCQDCVNVLDSILPQPDPCQKTWRIFVTSGVLSYVKLAHWGKMLCVHAHLKMLILQTNLEARHLRQRPQSWHVDTCLHVERKRKQNQTCSWTFPETHMPRDEAWSRYLVSGFQHPTQLTFKCTLVIPCFHVAGFLNHLCWQAPANTQTAELQILGLVQANIYKHHDRSWYFNGYVKVYHIGISCYVSMIYYEIIYDYMSM